MALAPYLHRLVEGHDLTEAETEAAISAVMEGQASELEIAALLTALRVRGETVDEIVGAARAMRARVTPIPAAGHDLLDTCGTGGDGLHTFNISTATALLVASMGIFVAKHGNRGVSSSSGSAEVLEQLGVNISLSPEGVAKCINTVGIGFCFAPLLHGAMRHAVPVRKQLGFRTIFNLLGPLTNPAGAAFQLVGTGRNANAEKMAAALARLGTRHALVVCGADEIDEVCLWGTTAVFEISGNSPQASPTSGRAGRPEEDAGSRVIRHTWNAESFGLQPCRAADLVVKTPQESAALIRRVFSGEHGPARNMVLANAAAALYAARSGTDLQEAVAQAGAALDDGRAARTLCRLAEVSHG